MPSKYEIACALADMVLQFAYRHKSGNTEWLDNGGLSALETAFSTLEDCGCKTSKRGSIALGNLLKFMDEMEKYENETDI